jgi:hypothetical protein
MLEGGLESEFLAVFASIKFDLRSIVASIESRVLSRTESVKFISEVFLIVAESAEYDREFTLVFLQVHEGSEERGD